ncbi:PLC-like phosphodiesterase [Basidiobolus meristosporus CBS 931.73]|uniref:PLC-like phosphodiesterase n=1 Tax=Basidiobolus meristosporus CBS 931.73 TaxID=1314790 RepID=A0A1Y1YYY2_9FUNG|nr:PLC-like phosphodiesterase [Basidiobolus meristosporus CBS 931.73]|eukprot:ORY02785.1 PLC-like phosphodiesterase [Basidiobolus meristosporus CBS 931.73]
MIHPSETPYVPSIYRANTPWMPGEQEELQKQKSEEPTKTQHEYWNRLDHFSQVFPIISQARSLMQLAVGDTQGAKQTQSNFINRFLEGVAGKLPEAPDLTNRSKWMEETATCVPEFGNKKLYEISIPATHNSATYITIQAGSPWVVCQRHSIYNQLRGGIRSLDFRVCDDSGDGNLWVSHGSLCSHLINHLEEIKQFLHENPKEIVLLLMKKDWDRKLSTDGLATLKRIILNFFGTKLITKKEMLESSVSELMSQGKQLGFYHESLKFGEPIELLPTNWSWDKTHYDVVEPLFEELIKWGEEQKYENKQFTALECILTPSVHSVVTTLRPLSEVTKPVHEKLLELLRSNWTAQTNVITFDYCPDAIIEEVIKRNF